MTDAGIEVVAKAVEPIVRAVAPAVQQAAPQAVGVFWAIIPLVALALVFLVELVRSLPWVDKMKAQKPWNCDTCLTFWSAGALSVYVVAGLQQSITWTAIHLLPGAGLAALLLALRGYWRGNLGPPPA